MFKHTTPYLFGASGLDVNMVDVNLPSSWIYLPYFLLYFLTYMLNTLVWPLMLVEHSCIQNFPNETFLQTDSCIKNYLNSTLHYKTIDLVDYHTINTMIVASIGSAISSLGAYFIIWKPILSKCRTIAVLLPPVCLLLQSFLQMYALKFIKFPFFNYIIIAAVCVPSFHANFQGVLLLFHQLKAPIEKLNFKQRQEYANMKLEFSHCSLFIAIIFVGFVIGTCFDLSYILVFMLESMFTALTCVYGILMLPNTCSCDIKDEETDTTPDDDLDSLSSHEERQLTNMAKFKEDKGLLSNESNLFTEAPMIFSETSYQKEFVIIIELAVFTIAVIADTAIIGPYLIQKPFSFSLKEIGYCISLQGMTKTVGFLLIKTCLYFKGIKHGTLILISALNYVIYYIVIGTAKTKTMIYFAMVTNIFGGLALPTISSFIMLNFNETSATVLELGTISSLIVMVGFSSLEYFIYIKTVNIMPGAIFLVTAAIIVVGFVLALGTFFSTTIRNKRRTKDFADTLLNDYE